MRLLTATHLLALFAAFVWLSSCSPRSASEIAGTYTSSGDGMHDTLILSPDFTYIQDVLRDGATEHEKYAGKWKYEKGDVILEGDILDRAWIPGTSRRELKRFSGIVMLPAERWFGPLKLGSDEGPQYVRDK